MLCCISFVGLLSQRPKTI